VSARRRILFLTPLPLDLPRSGGTIKSAALLAHLERSHDVDVVCPPRARPRSVARLLASYAARVPLSVERNRTPELAAALLDLAARRRPDTVFVDGWLMAQYLPPAFGGLRLLHQHNVEHQMWERHAATEARALRRGLVRAEARRVEAYERRLLPRFDLVFAVSEADRRAFVALGADPERTAVLPNVADPSLLERPVMDPPAAPTALFFGTLSWPPNAEGLHRFLRGAVAPLRQRVPGARVVIAGRGADGALTAAIRSTPGAELVSEVADDEVLYGSARCFVDASVGGAGTRVKILNALARGLPVVATADAASGLDVHPGVHLLQAGDPGSLAEPIARIMTDEDLWRRLSVEGRRLIRDRYSPPRAFAALDDALADPGG
jgi:glycosyltransferase involved in cell wall biosynthesis